VSGKVCRHSLQSPRSGWPVILSISASRKTSGGKIEAPGPEFGDIKVPELVAGLSVCGIADGMLHLLFRLPAFLLLAPRLLPALGETGPDIVRALPCALLGGTRTFAQFLPGRQGDRLVLGEKAGPMADAAAQGDGRPQPVRGGERAGGRPDVTTVPMPAGCADSGPAGRVEAEPWIRHHAPASGYDLQPVQSPPGEVWALEYTTLLVLSAQVRTVPSLCCAVVSEINCPGELPFQALDHSDHLPGKAGKRAGIVSAAHRPSPGRRVQFRAPEP